MCVYKNVFIKSVCKFIGSIIVLIEGVNSLTTRMGQNYIYFIGLFVLSTDFLYKNMFNDTWSSFY